MDETIHVVAIVVDRAFGDKLVAMSRRLHVWVVDSPINRPAREKVWNETKKYTLDSGATLFFDDGTQPAEAVAIRMLEDVERHHGEGAHTPPLSRLEVYGTPLTASLAAALEDLGFSGFEESERGFSAFRPPEDAG